MLAALVAATASACTSPASERSNQADSPPGDRADAQDGTTDRSGSEPESDDQTAPESTAPHARIERDLDSFPPLQLDPNGPGSEAAYDALIADLRDHMDVNRNGNAAGRTRAAEPPWPDLRNPDPGVAYRSCSDFQNWIAENDPDPYLVSGYAAPNSPEWGWDRDLFSTQRSMGWLAGPATPPYSLSIVDVVDPGASPISDELLDQVPPGSAAVVYYDSVGTSWYLDDDGNQVEERSAWSNVGPWVAIMEPTDAGWRVWWDELVDPPPGEEWERGPDSRIEQFDRA